MHGAPATLYLNVLNEGQSVYVCNTDGLYLNINLITTVRKIHRPMPGAASLGGALTMARLLRLLGTNPAAWTTDPVS